MEVHSRYMVQLHVQPNRRSRSSLTAPDSHWTVVYVNSLSFSWSGTLSTWSLTKVRHRRRLLFLSTLVNQRTSVAADDRVTISPYIVRYRYLRLSCDYATTLRIFDPHLRPCLQRRKFESAVSVVKCCFLVTSLDRLFRSQV